MSDDADKSDSDHDYRRKRVNYEHDMRVWEGRLQSGSAHLGALVNFASITITSIILANSASAGAVLAFLAPMWGKPEAAIVAPYALKCVSIFATGIFAAMASGAASYVAQFSYAQFERAEDGSRAERIWKRIGFPFHIFAVLAAIVGIGSFAWGACEGLRALTSAAGGVVAP